MRGLQVRKSSPVPTWVFAGCSLPVLLTLLSKVTTVPVLRSGPRGNRIPSHHASSGKEVRLPGKLPPVSVGGSC